MKTKKQIEEMCLALANDCLKRKKCYGCKAIKLCCHGAEEVLKWVLK